MHTYGESETEDEIRAQSVQFVAALTGENPTSLVVKLGSPQEEVADYASQSSMDLIVAGTHGRTGSEHLLMGSVAESIARRTHCPLVVVKPNAKTFTRVQNSEIQRVLCAMDVNELDQSVIDAAALLASILGAELDLLHVTFAAERKLGPITDYQVSPVEVVQDQERLRRANSNIRGIELRTHQLIGEPVNQVVQFVNQQEPDILVLGTHNRTGLRRLFGSVSESVMRQVSCPVMLIKTDSE